MIQRLLDAICLSLHSEFGNKYEIYTETMEQGLTEPCFSVFCLNPSSELFLGNRYYRRNLFCIQYFPETGEKEAECTKVLERLFYCMEYIYLTGLPPLRGTKMHGEIVDGVLNFFINYNAFVYKVEEINLMDKMQRTQTAVKEE